jgi:hypothetical protein
VNYCPSPSIAHRQVLPIVKYCSIVKHCPPCSSAHREALPIVKYSIAKHCPSWKCCPSSSIAQHPARCPPSSIAHRQVSSKYCPSSSTAHRPSIAPIVKYCPSSKYCPHRQVSRIVKYCTSSGTAHRQVLQIAKHCLHRQVLPVVKCCPTSTPEVPDREFECRSEFDPQFEFGFGVGSGLSICSSSRIRTCVRYEPKSDSEVRIVGYAPRIGTSGCVRYAHVRAASPHAHSYIYIKGVVRAWMHVMYRYI